MKSLNIFKKTSKPVAKAKIETLVKNQLEKVVGGKEYSPAEEQLKNNPRH